MKFYSKLLFLWLLIAISPPLSSQNIKTDSLLTSLQSEPNNIALLYELGSTYQENENFPYALKYLKESMRLSKELKDTSMLIKSLSSIGSVYRRVTNYDKAQAIFLEGLKFSEAHSKKESYSTLLMNIGVVYTDLGENNKALTYLFKGLEFLNQKDTINKLQIVKFNINIATAYGSMESLDKADQYFNKSLKILQEENDHEMMGAVLNNIGVNKLKIEQYTEALHYFRRAKRQFELADINFGVAMSLDNIGLIKHKQQLIQQAIDTTLLSVNLYSELGSLINVRDKYQRLITLYKTKGDNELALDFYSKWQNLNDSLDEPEMKARVHEMEQKYEIEKMELEHKNRLEILEHKQQVYNYKWFLVTSILFLLVLIITFFIYRVKNKHRLAKIKLEKSALEKKTLEEEVNYKNNELANFANYITKKRELLDNIKKAINSSSTIDESVKREVVQLLKLNLESDGDNKDFDVYIKQLHESFLFKLQNKFPTISERESQLCVLLMLELSSKEIASIMNITVGSVETARSRIRKKLNMPSDIKIPIFLKQL